MEYQNITLSLPKEILRGVKHLAIEEQTSVSGLLTRVLEELVRREDAFERARQRHLALLDKGLNLGTNGRVSWRREDLYER
ncbi:MAG: CopG family transcriptional regulator [Clostridia bacterium]|nr:CopG family transcriptional regulator [Clostridia bacterium]MDQ7792482.1 CopG family transcriptional regulator [Clostridia bacterium]